MSKSTPEFYKHFWTVLYTNRKIFVTVSLLLISSGIVFYSTPFYTDLKQTYVDNEKARYDRWYEEEFGPIENISYGNDQWRGKLFAEFEQKIIVHPYVLFVIVLQVIGALVLIVTLISLFMETPK